MLAESTDNIPRLKSVDGYGLFHNETQADCAVWCNAGLELLRVTPRNDRQKQARQLENRPVPEEGCSDANLRGALFDGHFKIMRHAHGKNRQRLANLLGQSIA